MSSLYGTNATSLPELGTRKMARNLHYTCSRITPPRAQSQPTVYYTSLSPTIFQSNETTSIQGYTDKSGRTAGVQEMGQSAVLARTRFSSYTESSAEPVTSRGALVSPFEGSPKKRRDQKTPAYRIPYFHHHPNQLKTC